MSVHISSLAWKIEHISMAEKVVLVKLADYANQDSGEAWPSLNTVARECCCTEKTVRNNIAKLRERGLIDCIPSRGKVTRYKLKFWDGLPGAGSTPESLTGVGDNGADPGISYRGPRNLLPGSPVTNSTEPERTVKKPEMVPPSPQRRKRKFNPIAYFHDLRKMAGAEWPILENRDFCRAYVEWLEHRVQLGKPGTEHAVRRQLKSCQGLGAAQAVRNIEYSIERGWEGIYAPREFSEPGARSRMPQSRESQLLGYGQGESAEGFEDRRRKLGAGSPSV